MRWLLSVSGGQRRGHGRGVRPRTVLMQLRCWNPHSRSLATAAAARLVPTVFAPQPRSKVLTDLPLGNWPTFSSGHSSRPCLGTLQSVLHVSCCISCSRMTHHFWSLHDIFFRVLESRDRDSFGSPFLITSASCFASLSQPGSTE